MTLLFVCVSAQAFDMHDPCPLTPTAPADYTAFTISFTFTHTVTEHIVTIPTVNDNVVETIKGFFVNLRLVSSNARFLINPARATVNIRSEDGRLPLRNLELHIIIIM